MHNDVLKSTENHIMWGQNNRNHFFANKEFQIVSELTHLGMKNVSLELQQLIKILEAFKYEKICIVYVGDIFSFVLTGSHNQFTMIAISNSIGCIV